MIDDGVSGYLIDSGTKAVERIGELLGSSELREGLGRTARARASGISWKTATLQLVEYYEKARETQAQRVIGVEVPAVRGVRGRTQQALRRGTIFAVRKLLP
jgi:hypothetical protein